MYYLYSWFSSQPAKPENTNNKPLPLYDCNNKKSLSLEDNNNKKPLSLEDNNNKKPLSLEGNNNQKSLPLLDNNYKNSLPIGENNNHILLNKKMEVKDNVPKVEKKKEKTFEEEMAEFNKNLFGDANFFDGNILGDTNKLNNLPKFGGNITFEDKNNITTEFGKII